MRVLVFLCFISPVAWAQSPSDSTLRLAPAWNDPFVSFHVGGVLPELSRNPPAQLARLNENLFWSYRAGLTIEAINTRWYGFRIELDYVRRGGQEEFAGLNNLLIESKTSLHYMQASCLPAIAKVGWPRFRWFAGAGGYVSYLFLSDLTYTFRGGYVVDSNELFEKSLNGIDYGAIVSTGFYWKKMIAEVRYEAGLASVYQYPDGRVVRNRALSFFIHF